MRTPSPSNSPESELTPEAAAAQRARRDAMRKVIADTLRRRSRGETLPDEVVIAAHADLEPELACELAALRSMHRTFLAAQRAGRLDGQPLQDLASTLELEQLATGLGEEFPHRVVIQGYTIVREISSGGQGTVFQATQDATGRQVAIKVISGGPLTGSRHRARFEREATILAKLDHPNIVGILDRGRTADSSLFLVMPFIEGTPLDAWMEELRNAPMPDFSRLLRLFALIAEAVAEAHRKAIVHRDLKPQNVRIGPQDRPFILDFGLARVQSDLLGESEVARTVTHTGQIVGSLPWTSPEQISREAGAVGIGADVYALGVMLYQGLTGIFPYAVFGPVGEVMENIARAVPKPPSEAAPEAHRRMIPRELDAIVLRALAKRPEDRYASAQDLAVDLQRHLAGKPLILPMSRIAHGRSRRRWLLVAAVAVLTVLAAAVPLATRYWNRRVPMTYLRAIDIGAKLPSMKNSVGMQLVRIPAGTFVMGSPQNEVGRGADEQQHRVVIERPFWIGETEVTQRQYRDVMGVLPEGITKTDGNLPVCWVSYHDAMEYCRRLGDREGRRYRLPSEAEWEYACRASPRYAPYGGAKGPHEMGWFRDNSGGRLHAVKQKWPNEWGLYDMHGNVREWCADIYAPASPLTGSTTEPLPGSVANYVLRGGDFASDAARCRSAARIGWAPATTSGTAGFRVVLEDK